MATEKPEQRQAKEALEALREIEKAKLKFEAVDKSASIFADLAMNAMWLIGDLATDAIRRIEAAKKG